MALGRIAGRIRLPGGISVGANIPIGVDPKKANKKTIEDIGTNNITPRNSINRMMANVKNSNLFSRPYLYYILILGPFLLLKITFFFYLLRFQHYLNLDID